MVTFQPLFCWAAKFIAVVKNHFDYFLLNLDLQNDVSHNKDLSYFLGPTSHPNSPGFMNSEILIIEQK